MPSIFTVEGYPLFISACVFPITLYTTVPPLKLASHSVCTHLYSCGGMSVYKMLPCQTALICLHIQYEQLLQWLFSSGRPTTSECYSYLLYAFDAVLFLGRRATTGSCFSSCAMMGPMCVVRWQLNHL